jgi:hypothetical protein
MLGFQVDQICLKVDLPPIPAAAFHFLGTRC